MTTTFIFITMKPLLLATLFLLSSLLASSANADDGSEFELKASEPVHVDHVYTYGAPSVVTGTPISHPNNECIPGIRVYNEDVDVVECSWYEKLWCTPGKQVTNVDFASQINLKNGYLHPKMATLVVRLVDGSNVEYTYQPCHSYTSSVEEYQLWPDANLPSNMFNNNHGIAEFYITRLAQVTDSVKGLSLQYASVSVCVQKSSFDEVKYCIENFEEETAVGNEGVAHAGWEPFAYMKSETEGMLSDSDTVIVLKKDNTSTNYRSCIIGFQGSDSLLDFSNFVSSNNEETSYCGRYGVHTGTANELWHLTHDSQYASEIVPALESCHEVTCVGHSLGGALCSLFTMCANRGLEYLQNNNDSDLMFEEDANHWDDYNSLIWTKKSYVTDESSW